jgi:hypothetical protein
MKNLLIAFLLTASYLLIFSCNSNVPKEEISSSLKYDETRTIKKSPNFKAVASFEKGKCISGQNELEQLSNTDLSFIVFYDSNVEWANIFNSGVYEKTGDDNFNKILMEYKLVISEQRAYDESSEMLMIEPNQKLEKPDEVAKEISNINGVISVHIQKNKEATTKIDEIE